MRTNPIGHRVDVGGVGYPVPVGAQPHASWSSSSPQLFEYVFYGLVAYALMGEAFGVSVPMLGALGFATLAGLCVLRQQTAGYSVREPLTFPLVFIVAYIVVQTQIHNESILDSYVRTFVTWAAVLIVVQMLCNRPGFFLRFSLFMFVVGLTVIPFIKFNQDERAQLEIATAVSNPNELGAWFGFCALVFAIRGMDARRTSVRWMSFGIAIFSLLAVGYTVSRTSLAAVAVGGVLIMRGRLRRGFLPMLGLMLMLAAALAMGVFDPVIAQYVERGMEDTGRLAVWPQIIARIINQPLIGVGVGDIATFAPAKGRMITPHNGVLFVALAGGIVPAVLFLWYWWISLVAAFRTRVAENPEAAYLLPLIVYSFLITMSSNQAFTSTWIAVVVCLCMRERVRARARVAGADPA